MGKLRISSGFLLSFYVVMGTIEYIYHIGKEGPDFILHIVQYEYVKPLHSSVTVPGPMGDFRRSYQIDVFKELMIFRGTKIHLGKITIQDHHKVLNEMGLEWQNVWCICCRT